MTFEPVTFVGSGQFYAKLVVLTTIWIFLEREDTTYVTIDCLF